MYVFEEYKNSNRTIFMPSVCPQAFLYDHPDQTLHLLGWRWTYEDSEALRFKRALGGILDQNFFYQTQQQTFKLS